MSAPYRHILGMKVNAGTYETSTDHIKSWAKAGEARYVCVANVHMTMETVDSAEFKHVVNSADLVTSDGMPLVWMLKRLGMPFSERVYGPELVLRVCEMAENEGLNIGLFGGTDESLSSFQSYLSSHFPSLNVSYSWAPPFRPLTEREDQQVVADISASNTHILFVGIGCPKQEKWMFAHRKSIQAVQIGVGAAFDFHSGRVKQAPQWMGNSGLEWLFRFAMEPKRLWKRYLVHNPRFMARAAVQLFKNRLGLVATLFAVCMTMGMTMRMAPTPLPASKTVWVSQNNPVSSDANPGTRALPFRTISAPLGLGMIEPGDTLMIESGVYREEIRPTIGGLGPSRRIYIMGAPGHQVVVSGADPQGQPKAYSDSLWVINNYNPLGFYGDGSTYERELVVADHVVLFPVFNFDDLVRGSFYVQRSSESRGRIFLNSGSVSPPSVEIASRGSLFKPGSEWTGCDDSAAPGWYYIKNISFVHAANQAQAGAVCLGSEGTVLDSVQVNWTNGVGIEAMGRNHEIVNSIANHNGQSGINGTCQNCLLVGSETSFNNRVGHDPFWEAGGGKWIASHGLTIRYHTSIGNDGPGIWFDGDNYDIHLSYSKFDRNLVAGVFVELRSEKVFIENVSVSNTRRLDWSGTGILIQAAANVVVEQSDISNNDGAGIWARSDDRFEGGYNQFVNNHFDGNGKSTGQDEADIQIEATDLINLCSNRIQSDLVRADSTSILFEIAEPYEVIRGSQASQLVCLVQYD